MYHRAKTDKIVNMLHSIMSDLGPAVYKQHASDVSKASVSLVRTVVGEDLMPRVGPMNPRWVETMNETKPFPVLILGGTIPFRYQGEEYHAPVDIYFPPRYHPSMAPMVHVIAIHGHVEINEAFAQSWWSHRWGFQKQKFVMYIDRKTETLSNAPGRTTLTASIMELTKLFSADKPPVFSSGRAIVSAHHHPYSRARAPLPPRPFSTEKQAAQRPDGQDNELPDELMCPLTYELMKCPVLTDDGQVYEKKAIETWFGRFPADRKPRSPYTNLELKSRSLIWSFSLKAKCDEFRVWEATQRKRETCRGDRLTRKKRRKLETVRSERK